MVGEVVDSSSRAIDQRLVSSEHPNEHLRVEQAAKAHDLNFSTPLATRDHDRKVLLQRPLLLNLKLVFIASVVI